MNLFNKIGILIIISYTLILGGEKRVLVEMFTNSHCPLCPAAHSALDNYLTTSNGDKIDYIYYHMQFPYSSDKLYQHNTTDSQTKNSLYGSFSATPQAFFDGVHVSNSYGSWASALDNKLTEESKFDIVLSGSYSDNDFTIEAEVTLTGDITASDLTINYVVLENVIYAGNNGISNHKNVMRKIVNPAGDNFSINLNETKTLSAAIEKNNEWNTENLKVAVFVQSSSTKEVFQSSIIPYNNFSVTGIEEESGVPATFSLEQNYPNPFNPATIIQYSIPSNIKLPPLAKGRVGVGSHVTLKVYDIQGREVATLVNEAKQPGNNEVVFDAENLSSGMYFYELRSGNFRDVKKLLLLK